MPHYASTSTSTSSTSQEYQKPTPIGQLWWNINIAEDRWTVDCPDYLRGLGDKDIEILSSRDEDHHYLSWSDCKRLVASNRIDEFHRVPSDLRLYLEYMAKLRQKYGSVLGFVQSERLHWPAVRPSNSVPFSNPADYKILYNDWPYGIDKDITHLVVWTKFEIEDDAATGFLTAQSRRMLDDFVAKTFCGKAGMRREDVTWFKNWTSLKSIHALEHFHVMLYKAPSQFLEYITDHDRPMSEMVARGHR